MRDRASSTWLKGTEAMEMMGGISKQTLARVVDEGRIGIMQIPGVKARRYRRADVEILIAKSTRLATDRELVGSN